jgi:hypothetical protein
MSRHAVWLYLRFTLSYRDVEELLAERGIEVSYETVRRWVVKFGPAFGCLERQIAAFVENDNHARYHEGLGNVAPADVYFGRGRTILIEREKIKRQIIASRRLHHHAQAA